MLVYQNHQQIRHPVSGLGGLWGATHISQAYSFQGWSAVWGYRLRCDQKEQVSGLRDDWDERDNASTAAWYTNHCGRRCKEQLAGEGCVCVQNNKILLGSESSDVTKSELD